jgi:hypothetical protein
MLSGCGVALPLMTFCSPASDALLRGVVLDDASLTDKSRIAAHDAL